ncbi:MAG: DUF2062 domain-containing protein [Gammaproteobacteria bacterium]|nr:MAG: DUF2062 domain-containing protein [Gammaproteobacteria bacterium]
MKKRLKEWLPQRETLLRQRALSAVAHLLHDENLWHLNRRSVARGGAIGVFLAFMPILGQMPLAVVTAVFLRGNIPVALALTWISNPFTAPPIFYGCYRLGQLLLGGYAASEPYHFTVHWFLNNLTPLALGSLVAGTLAALLTHFLLTQLWKADIQRRWQQRRDHRTKTDPR